MSVQGNHVAVLPKMVQWAIVWLFILCSVYVVNAFVALLGLHVFSVTLPVCVVISLVGLYWLAKREGRPLSKRFLVITGLVFMTAVVLFGYIVAWIWEYSSWGRGFYTEAIVRLADGWNPIYDDASAVSEAVMQSGKALWYVDASIYAFLGHYEMAKCHTLLFAVPAFLLTRYTFFKLLGGHKRVATMAALLSLVNPVAISQLFSFYGDAVMAYCIQCFLLLAYLILNEGYLHTDLLAVLGGIWLFILHSPSGGLCAALVLGAAFLIIVAILYKKRALRWLSIRAGVVALFGFVILGFNPFIQNLVDNGSLLCTVDLVSPSMPVILEGKTWFGRFIYSLFASPDVASLNVNTVFQQFTALFHSAYAQPDVPLRGFGFIGGLLIILAVILVFVAIFLPRRSMRDENAIYLDDETIDEEAETWPDYLGQRTAFLWLLLPILLIALFTSTIWWARSIAVLWFAIPLAVVALSTRRNDGRSRSGKMLLLLAFLNCALVAFSALPAAKQNGDMLEAHWLRMTSSTDLPSDEDAQLHNQIVTQFKAWNSLKQHGEKEREAQAIWTKIEGLVK
ncbi:MAG: hypothetical protein UDB11_09230 [Peptococcaceae bacterium]|nr:hypothetical protein [Peptococcaceae bacterium]